MRQHACPKDRLLLPGGPLRWWGILSSVEAVPQCAARDGTRRSRGPGHYSVCDVLRSAPPVGHRLSYCSRFFTGHEDPNLGPGFGEAPHPSSRFGTSSSAPGSGLGYAVDASPDLAESAALATNPRVSQRRLWCRSSSSSASPASTAQRPRTRCSSKPTSMYRLERVG